MLNPGDRIRPTTKTKFYSESDIGVVIQHENHGEYLVDFSDNKKYRGDGKWFILDTQFVFVSGK